MELYVSQTGGHIGPVGFKLKHRWVSPYYAPPWKPETCEDIVPPVFRLLRGGFLGFPFERRPRSGDPFGTTANEPWRVTHHNVRSMELQQKQDEKGGVITKRLFLENDHRALYQEHVIEGISGRRSVGAMNFLDISDADGASLAVSPFNFGQTSSIFHAPEEGTYSFLSNGAEVPSLSAVPLVDGSTADFTHLPLLPGYDGQVLLGDVETVFPWVALTFPRYVWFSLRCADTLPGLLLWTAQGGMHGEPWRGRFRNVLGVGEVCSWFDDTVQVSRQKSAGGPRMPTALRLSRRNPTVLRTIQAIHPVERDFGAVATIEPLPDGSGVEVRSISGHTCKVPLNWSFLKPPQNGAGL